MSSILLISVNSATDPYPVYPLGMSMVARALLNAGHEVRQFDLLSQTAKGDALLQIIRDSPPHFVGLSLRNIDNVDSFSATQNWQLDSARAVTQQLVAMGLTVILGGPGFSLMPGPILTYLGAHHGVVGEGESLMVQLIARLETGQPAPAILYAEPQSSPPISMPLYASPLLRYYLKAGGILGVQTKRGCENRCAYCTYPGLEGNTLRHRDHKDIIEELIKLRRTYNVHMVFFTDSIFNDRSGNHLALAEEMIRNDVTMAWSAYFRPSAMTRDQLRLLKRSGLKAIEAGTDAGCDETLQAMGKPFSMDEVRQFHRLCVSERVPCAHFVIFGGPGETMDTVRQGIDNLNQLEHAVVFPFSGVRLHRQTALFRRAVKEGVVSENDSLLRPVFYFSPAVNPDEMNAVLLQGFAGRRDRMFPPTEAQMRMRILRSFGYHGLLWDTLIQFDTAQPVGRIRAQGTTA